MNYRLALLKQDPRRMTDRDLAMAATYLLAERLTLGPERVDRVMRDLHRRGMDLAGIARLTGFPLVRVYSGVHGRPPRLEVPGLPP